MLIFNEIDLSENAESDVINLTDKPASRPDGVYIFFQWYDVVGVTKDGAFTIYAYAENDTDTLKPFMAGFDDNVITVSTADNTTNCSMVAIPFGIQKIKIKYVANNITGGVGNVAIQKGYK